MGQLKPWRHRDGSVGVAEFEDRPLMHEDGEPVADVPGLVWYQDCPVPEDAWAELSQRLTNGAA